MWSDDFVNTCMFWSPQNDSLFANATARCIWPRTAIAAGSFWRHDATLQEISPVVETVQKRLSRRGFVSCRCTNATHNGCDQATRCDGTRYCPRKPGPHPPPSPPRPPPGKALRCSNYSLATGYRCIDRVAGPMGDSLRTETLSCATPGACAAVAAARCSSAVPRCGRFSFAFVIPPTSTHPPTSTPTTPTTTPTTVKVNVSFFAASPPRPTGNPNPKP